MRGGILAFAGFERNFLGFGGLVMVVREVQPGREIVPQALQARRDSVSLRVMLFSDARWWYSCIRWAEVVGAAVE